MTKLFALSSLLSLLVVANLVAQHKPVKELTYYATENVKMQSPPSFPGGHEKLEAFIRNELDTLDRFVNTYVNEYNFNGTILIQRNGKVHYHQSFGLANRPFSVPDTNETKYKIASITKLFTAVLILQLHEQGKIGLAQTINTYLPHYTGEGATKVTIHQLLNHTSGMVNIDTITSIESALKNGLPVYQKPLTSEELLIKYCSDTLVSEPGKVFNYNNAEYIILGKIIEQIERKPYEQVLQERILQPLQMKNSGFLHQHDVVKQLADTYFLRDDLKQLVNDLPVYIENWYAAGAMYATTTDLLTFLNALFGTKLLKKETLAMMVKPGLDAYGYSVWVGDWEFKGKKYTTIQRPGRIMGAQGKLVYFLNGNLTIILLSNTGTVNMDEFAYELSNRIME